MADSITGVPACIAPAATLSGWRYSPLCFLSRCTFVVKPSEHTPASTLEFARLFAEAGFPPGVFNVVTGYGPGTGGPLVRHPGVDKVAFTGSTATGIRVMKDAADHLARVSLELGGKSPNIVFADADEGVINGVVAGIFAAGGQEEGAQLVTGGKIPTDPDLVHGFFVEPTIFTQVDNKMRIAQEEVFGPVLSVIPFQTEEEVIRQANETRYGLAAGIWTRDIRRAHRVAHALRAGTRERARVHAYQGGLGRTLPPDARPLQAWLIGVNTWTRGKDHLAVFGY